MAAIPLLIGSIVALLASVLSYTLTGMNAAQATMMYFAIGGAVCLAAFAWSRVSVRTANTI
jgi:hypothetical protein